MHIVTKSNKEKKNVQYSKQKKKTAEILPNDDKLISAVVERK